MFKFLRKYNKLLLAIFGVLLMITFLIPQAISKFGQQAGVNRASVATVGDGEKVSGEKWAQVQRETQFLQRVGIGLPGAESAQQIKPEHWYLLTREAEAAGLVASGASLDLPESSLTQAAISSGERDLNFIRTTLAKTRGVFEMLDLFQGSNTFSDRHLKHAARRMLNQVVAQVVVLEAQRDSTHEPSEEEIAAHFAKYADVQSGTGDEGFGYRLPDRVKLEWLRVSADSVREVVRQSDAYSPVAQRLHWKRFENEAAKQFPKAEGAIPEVVKHDLLEQLTREKLEEISKFAADVLRLNRRGIPERDGYVALPEDWDQRKINLMTLAESIRDKFGIELPEYQSSGNDWVLANDLSKTGDIASATTDKFGSFPLGLSQLVQATRELQTDKEAGTTIFIQKDIAGPPLKGADGSVFVFRIIDADPAHAPASVDEVREAVVADLQRIADYQRLAASAAEIEREAEAKGMLGVATAHDTIVQPSVTLSLSNRFMLTQFAQAGRAAMVTPSNLPIIGQHRKTVEAVLDYAAALPADKAIGGLDGLSEDERVLVVPVEEKRALMVFRLVRVNPLTEEEYAEVVRNGSIQQLLATDDAKSADIIKDAFGYDAIVKRHNFSFIRTRSDEETQTQDTASVG